MSLDYRLNNIKDFENLCWLKQYLNTDQPIPEGWYRNKENQDVIERLNPVTSALIWITVAIDMGDITEGNVIEFYARVACFEKMFGNYLTSDEGPRPITLEDIKAHIGLHTNVGLQPWSTFVKRQMLNLRSNVLRALPDEERRRQNNQRETLLSEQVEVAIEALAGLQEGLDEKADEPLFEDNIDLPTTADYAEEAIRYLKKLQKTAERVEALEEQRWDRLAEAADAHDQS
jgi:hypothetical protein